MSTLPARVRGIRGSTDVCLDDELCIKGGGGGGFGSILSSVGSLFGGFFADGGTLKPGQFGVVGERGPELAFAGSSPMQIMPNGMMPAPVNVSMNIQTPDAGSFRQSQTQIAADMARSIERARRNL